MDTHQPLSRKELRQQERERKHADQQHQLRAQKMKKRAIALTVVVLVIAAVIGLVMLQQQKLNIVNVTPDPSKGSAQATVVVAEYADFQCPSCAASAPVVEALVAEYGDAVRFEYNDFPLPQHEYALDAAIAAQCAFDQGKFFELHDILFDKQSEWSNALTHDSAQATMRAYAETLALDMTAFDSCVVSPEISKRIDEDMIEARAAGVNSTPTFFVNGKRVTDTPFSVNVKKAIDEALAE
ncbi:MAG: DsbA family protein [Candidatus Kerfeldbacteria bacterium]|nr:DsbA family protein [Candidatus Kerfeldbacteria bacterium]